LAQNILKEEDWNDLLNK